MAVQAPESPLFPTEVLGGMDVAENQLSSSGGLSMSIVQAEPVLFLRGFTPTEFAERPPAILRGSLVLRVARATKIKSVTLTFKGITRTEWPEGIPPKKNETYEKHEIHSHVWPFFNATFPMAEYSSGAHLVRPHRDFTASGAGAGASAGAGRSGALAGGSTHLGVDESARTGRRSRSGSMNSLNAPSIASTTGSSGIKGLASRLRRAASPGPASSSAQAFSGLSLGPHRSFSKEEAHDHDTKQKGYRVFEPGEYYYNFELPIPQSLPETISAAFGSVKYTLEGVVERPGAFKSNLTGTTEVKIVRAASDNNLESSEPIAITRDWEDQLHYEIVIAGKAFPLGTSIPIAVKFAPLAKIMCHRVRVYVTENTEYYCRNKKVHRIEPTRKFLLHEQLPQDGIAGTLLDEWIGNSVVSATEMEYNVELPEVIPLKKYQLHPNTSFDDIKVHHWIKIVFRLSKVDPNNSEKRKYYEVSIDSPISLLDSHCTDANLLPEYEPAPRRRPSLLSTVSGTTVPVAVRHQRSSSGASTTASNGHAGRGTPEVESYMQRPIHLLRKPSVAPPPFDADVPPPTVDAPPPPGYGEAVTDSVQSYEERYHEYELQHQQDSIEQPRLSVSSSQSASTSVSVTSDSSASSQATATSGGPSARHSDRQPSSPGVSQGSAGLGIQTPTGDLMRTTSASSGVSARSRGSASSETSVASALSNPTSEAVSGASNSTSNVSDASGSNTSTASSIAPLPQRRPSEIDPFDGRTPRLGRESSVASSIDIVEQQMGPPSRPAGLASGFRLEPPAEHPDEHHRSESRSSLRTPSEQLSRTVSSTSSVGRPSVGIEDLGEGDRVPLLSRRKSSVRDGLMPMDSHGDIGLADIDDSESLKSTPSLWIS